MQNIDPRINQTDNCLVAAFALLAVGGKMYFRYSYERHRHPAIVNAGIATGFN